MRSNRTIKFALGLMLIAAGSAFAGPESKLTAGKSVEVFQGEIVELKVSGDGFSAVQAEMGGERIPFFRSHGGAFTGLMGADLEAPPGWAKVFVKATTHDGTHRQSRIRVKVKARAFPRESFSVPSEFEPLSSEVLERIRQEQEQLSSALTVSPPQPLWEGPFLPPVSGGVTSPFGFRRVINGLPRAPHSGVDLKAPLGTEVLSPNHGRVVLAADFFFSGKSLVVDHGGGLYTMYFHLSEFKVDAGMEIHKGEILALSGMTGRVTGPHLHWGARINGARINPFELVEKLAGRLESTGKSKPKIRGDEN